MQHTKTYSRKIADNINQDIVSTNSMVNFPNVLDKNERHYLALKTSLEFSKQKEHLLWDLQKGLENDAIHYCSLDLSGTDKNLQNIIKTIAGNLSIKAHQLSQILNPTEYTFKNKTPSI